MERSAYKGKRWRLARLATLTRDGWTCQIRRPGCLGRATEADHIRALAEGGDPYDLANLRAACKPCNAGLGGELARDRAQRRPWPDWL